jgi:hypothetical protein
VFRTDTNGSVQVTIEPDGEIGVVASGARKAAAAPVAVLARAAGTVAIARPRSSSEPPLLVRPRSTFACGIPSTG